MVKRVQGSIVRLREFLDFGEDRLRRPFTRRDLAVLLGAVGAYATQVSDEITATMPKRRQRKASK